MFTIAGTKLNKNHCNGQFEKHNYKMYRRDQPLRGNYVEGIVAYVNTTILCQRQSEYECDNYDTIPVELHISKRKWICIYIYHSIEYSLAGFLNEMENILNRAFCKYDYVIVMGDYNANILKIDTNSKAIKDVCTSFNLKTSFTSLLVSKKKQNL